MRQDLTHFLRTHVRAMADEAVASGVCAPDRAGELVHLVHGWLVEERQRQANGPAVRVAEYLPAFLDHATCRDPSSVLSLGDFIYALRRWAGPSGHPPPSHMAVKRALRRLGIATVCPSSSLLRGLRLHPEWRSNPAAVFDDEAFFQFRKQQEAEPKLLPNS